MNKTEFMRQLKKELRIRNVKDIPEILADYEEHFAAAIDEKTEQEIIEELGSVSQIADEYSVNKGGLNIVSQNGSQNANQTIIYKKGGDSGLFVLLIFLDVILGIAIAGVIFAVVVSLTAGSAALIVGGSINSVFSFFIFGAVSIKFAGFFASLAAVGLGILGIFSIKPTFKLIFKLIKQYIALHKRALVGGNV